MEEYWREWVEMEPGKKGEAERYKGVVDVRSERGEGGEKKGEKEVWS